MQFPRSLMVQHTNHCFLQGQLPSASCLCELRDCKNIGSFYLEIHPNCVEISNVKGQLITQVNTDSKYRIESWNRFDWKRPLGSWSNLSSPVYLTFTMSSGPGTGHVALGKRNVL